MAEPRPSGGRRVSLPQLVVILVGLAVTLLAVLSILGITIGAVSGFAVTATLLIPALIFLALAVLLLGSALGLRRFGPPVWWVATIVSAPMLITMLAVMAITAQAPSDSSSRRSFLAESSDISSSKGRSSGRRTLLNRISEREAKSPVRQLLTRRT